jgi:dCMP deaminase
MSDSWDKFFMDMAKLVASKSKDRSRKVGCVIVGPDNEVRSVGYNGFPRGIADHIEWRHERPAKYKWTEHAERNAIYNSARAGIRTDGCRIYLPWFPCMDCARAIIQAGITGMVCGEPDFDDPTWGRDFRSGVDMLREAHVGVRYYCDEVA